MVKIMDSGCLKFSSCSTQTIRIQEVLDSGRAARKEIAKYVTLSNGSEEPLTLLRSVSQSCDPHTAFLYLELGLISDPNDGINKHEGLVSSGRPSKGFLFKARAKIPVDTVGVHRIGIDHNNDKHLPKVAESRNVGWIIVRVALKGGLKIVSIESPLIIFESAPEEPVA